MSARGNTTLAGRGTAARLTRAALILAAVVYVGALLVAPTAAIGVGAFKEGPVRFWQALFSDGGAEALLLSLVVAAIAVAVNVVLGTVVAWVLTRDRFPGQRLLSALVDLPFSVSPVIAGFALILLLGPRGWFAPWLKAADVQIVFALPGMALATIFVSLPFVIREVGLMLAESGRDQEEAAYTLGAGPVATFFQVTLPNIRWGLLSGALLTTARSLGEFGAVIVVSGGIAQATETGTLFIFRSMEERRDLSAFAMSVALAGLSVALIVGVEWLKRRHEKSLSRSP